ncbi:MAG: hypothetical protein ACI9HU_001909, partial [Colwellia sp.]
LTNTAITVVKFPSLEGSEYDFLVDFLGHK